MKKNYANAVILLIVIEAIMFAIAYKISNSIGSAFIFCLFITVCIILKINYHETTGNITDEYTEANLNRTDLATGSTIAELKNLNHRLDELNKKLK